MQHINKIGMIGLGRMGANMVRRLLRGGHECVVFDMSPKAVEELVQEKAVGAADLSDMVKKLETPRAVWLMVLVLYLIAWLAYRRTREVAALLPASVARYCPASKVARLARRGWGRPGIPA